MLIKHHNFAVEFLCVVIYDTMQGKLSKACNAKSVIYIQTAMVRLLFLHWYIAKVTTEFFSCPLTLTVINIFIMHAEFLFRMMRFFLLLFLLIHHKTCIQHRYVWLTSIVTELSAILESFQDFFKNLLFDVFKYQTWNYCSTSLS